MVCFFIVKLVGDFFYIDFTEGGHDKVFDFIPKKEIWIDDDLNPEERLFILVHELHERNLMKKNKNITIKKGLSKLDENYTKVYDFAHHSASKTEYYCRHNPEKLNKFIQKELKLSLKSN